MRACTCVQETEITKETKLEGFRDILCYTCVTHAQANVQGTVPFDTVAARKMHNMHVMLLTSERKFAHME